VKQRDQSAFLRLCQVAFARAVGLEVQRFQAAGVEVAFPRPDRVGVKIQHPRNILRSHAVVEQQQRVGPAHFQSSRLARAQDFPQLLALLRRQKMSRTLIHAAIIAQCSNSVNVAH
jgi:hypothetical protein